MYIAGTLLFLKETKLSNKLNWFKRHLNWTALLAGWLPVLIVYGFGTVLYWSALATDSEPPEITGWIMILLGFVAAFISLYLLLWVLKQKNRSLWYFLVLLLPFGYIWYLSLENRSAEPVDWLIDRFAVKALPDQIGRCVLDRDSVKSLGKGIYAEYKIDGDLVYIVRWPSEPCMVEEYYKGKMISVTCGKDLMECFRIKNKEINESKE